VVFFNVSMVILRSRVLSVYMTRVICRLYPAILLQSVGFYFVPLMSDQMVISTICLV
jgi:hypothetical protein